MALETKVILKLLTEAIGRAKTVEEAYQILAGAAEVEGINVPSYDEFLANIESTKAKKTKPE